MARVLAAAPAVRADVAAIGRDVGWRARRDVADMVRDLWAWQEANPAGYR